MSDFEINKAVCATKGVKIDNEQYEGLRDRDERIVLCRDELGMSIGVDYCNNPSDAWPIIIKNKVSIMNDLDLWEASIDFDGDLEKHGTDEVLTKHYEHANPLRAAMIVYLMLQDEL